MDKHREAPNAYELLLTLMITRHIDPFLFRSTADKAFDLHGLFLQRIDLVNDLLGVEVVHHGAERNGFHVDSRAGEAPIAKVLLDDCSGSGNCFYHVADYRVFRHFLFIRNHGNLLYASVNEMIARCQEKYYDVNHMRKIVRRQS